MGLLRPIVITALSLLIISWAVPSVSYGSWAVLVAASIVITLLQKIGRPVLHLLLLPINIVTLGLFSGVINVILMWLATALVPGFHIEPMTVLGHEFNYFFTLLLISFLISFAQSIVSFLF
jgi:putative membrane protein